MDEEKLFFINQAIIDRLAAGTFVPERRSKPASITLADRRETLSPLAIGKRCVRYEPYVFYNRKEMVLQLAKGMNDPVQKMVLITGPQGAGKTSLARGIVEMMGGGDEQLLWFDINVHTDFEEITQFLIQYITYISTALSLGSGAEENANLHINPMMPPSEKMVLEQLGHNIRKVAHIPLLIVIDNIEYIVDPEYQIQSFSFKEILNFLLSFPNIKMLLLGERLPYADISVDAEVITEIKLAGIAEKDGLKLLQYRQEETQPEMSTLQNLFRKAGGAPWLLRTLNDLAQKAFAYTVVDSIPLKPGHPFIEAVIRMIYDRLSFEEQSIVQFMAFLRHPLERKTLLALLRTCKPELSTQAAEQLLDHLDKSLLKPLLRKTFPPQVVLRQLRMQIQSNKEIQPEPWFELTHRQIKKIIYSSLPEEERLRIHHLLQEFYLKEKNKPFEQRIYRIKSKALVAEATFHSTMARKRRTVSQDEASLESKSYIFKGIKPSPGEKTITLEDYRKISLPNTPIDLSNQGFQQNEFESSEMVEGIPLTQEEKKLIFGSGSGSIAPKSQTPLPPSVFATDSEMFSSPPTENPFLDPVFRHTGAQHISRAMAESPLSPEEIYLSQTPIPPPAQVSRPNLELPDLEPSLEVPINLPLTAKVPMPAAYVPPPETQETPVLDTELIPHDEADEVERRLQQNLAQALANKNRPEVLHRLIELARYRATMGLFQSAEQCLEKAKALRSEASHWMMADLYALYGAIYKETQRYDLAVSYLLQAVELLGDDDDLLLPPEMQFQTPESAMEPLQRWERLGKVYLDLGEIATIRQHPKGAVRYFLKAGKYYGQTTNTLKQAEIMFKIAEVYDAQGLASHAISYYEQSLTLDKALENHLSCASTLVNIGTLHLEQGTYASAVRSFMESLAHDRRVDHREGQFKTLELLSKVYRAQEDWVMAEDAYHQALSIAAQEGNKFWQASVYLNLGTLNAVAKNWRKALEYYKSAESCAPEELSEKSKNLLKRKIQEASHYVNQQS